LPLEDKAKGIMEALVAELESQRSGWSIPDPHFFDETSVFLKLNVDLNHFPVQIPSSVTGQREKKKNERDSFFFSFFSEGNESDS
jgi:hypothetical protein